MCVCVIVSASVLPYLNIGVNIQTCGDIFLAESGTCVVLNQNSSDPGLFLCGYFCYNSLCLHLFQYSMCCLRPMTSVIDVC